MTVPDEQTIKGSIYVIGILIAIVIAFYPTRT